MAQTPSVRDLVNDPRRVGVMSTASRTGEPNAAVFGSPYMPDELTLVMGLSDSRTAQNLLETGKAAFLSVLPHQDPGKIRGTRLYLTVRAMEKDGPHLDAVKERIRKAAGEAAAARIRYAVFFDVASTRPLIDWGPGK